MKESFRQQVASPSAVFNFILRKRLPLERESAIYILVNAFDVWMTRTQPDLPWCRYADDGTGALPQ